MYIIYSEYVSKEHEVTKVDEWEGKCLGCQYCKFQRQFTVWLAAAPVSHP
jgi:hypothetical protein